MDVIKIYFGRFTEDMIVFGEYVAGGDEILLVVFGLFYFDYNVVNVCF